MYGYFNRKPCACLCKICLARWHFDRKQIDPLLPIHSWRVSCDKLKSQLEIDIDSHLCCCNDYLLQHQIRRLSILSNLLMIWWDTQRIFRRFRSVLPRNHAIEIEQLIDRFFSIWQFFTITLWLQHKRLQWHLSDARGGCFTLILPLSR